MYAIIELGGRQHRVTPGVQVIVNRLTTAVGKSHVVEHVLLASDGDTVRIGKPYCPGAKVVCEVLDHQLGPKEISYRFRRRENYRRTHGHRQPMTRLLVKDITLS